MAQQVFNQSPPISGTSAWRSDPMLIQLGEAFSAPVRKEMEVAGRFARAQDALELARLANTQLPVLRTHDRYGHRVDLVEFHPAYHALMRRSASAGLHSSIWEDGAEEKGQRHQIRAMRYYLTAQLECGHLCPITMTNAALAALMASPELFRMWAPRVISRKYDQANRPASQKLGVTVGMGMTERQGGSDVRANTSYAERVGNGIYRISGHKWFLSAPMSDAFLVLAQATEGLSCFLVPRLRDDGSSNGFQFQRLKDKLGNRSNASTEVEFHGALGYLVGEPGTGVRTIMDMVTLTRLDCAVASAGLMRVALAEAVHHARHRQVFGNTLVEQPLMTRVLADLALDVAGATALVFRLARAFDVAAADRSEAAYARVMTPVTKYWVCKIAPAVIYEAMECLGGNGYVEDWPLARYYREAPVNAIWEGSGNVLALDVLRVLLRNGGLFDEVLDGIGRDLGKSGDRTIEVLRAAMRVCESDEGTARLLTEQFALAAAAAELKRLGAGRVADAFLESRLAGQWRNTYGMLDARHDAKAILDVLYPEAT